MISCACVYREVQLGLGDNVDSEARRHQIAEAVWRLAAKGGLERVSMRQVAMEANVSTRLVQYYFGTRDDLLTGALRYRHEYDLQRIKAKVPAGATIRTVLRETLLGLLPVDDEGRTMYLLNVAYFVRALTDPAIISLFKREGQGSLEDAFLALLGKAAQAGQLRKGLNLVLETERLIALRDGMSSRLLLKMRSMKQAKKLIDYHLDGIFKAS